MANTVTLAQLKTRSRQRADMEDSSFISDSELLSYINGSYAELYDILVSKFEDYFVTTSTFTIASGNNTQSLPTDFYKLRGLDYKIDANNWITVKKFNFAQRNAANNSFIRGRFGVREVEYRIVGNNLLIEPEDNAAGDYKIWYTPVFTLLSSDTDTVDGVNGWEDYIVIDVAIKMLSKEESSVTHLEKEKAAMAQRIEVMSQNRDYDQPEQIADNTNDNYRLLDRIFLMSLKSFKKISIDDYSYSTLQDNVDEFLGQIVKNPRLNGRLIEGIQMTLGQTTSINHGLGRKITGFEVIYKNNSVDVWAEDANQTLPARQLVLSTSATATISLWVY